MFSRCISYVADRVKRCAQYRDDGYNECTQTKDEGYNSCTETRDEGYKNCCDWWPCSWACDAWTWVSNIVCVAWTWISNIVCVAWQWIKNIVCVAWEVFVGWICLVWSVYVLVLGSLVYLIAKIVQVFTHKDWLNGNPPTINNPDQAFEVYCAQTKDTYKDLTDFDRFIAVLSTPFKEFGIRGWTDYHILACAEGRVLRAVTNSDGLYTVDLEVNDGDFIVLNQSQHCEHLGYIRAEIFPNVTQDIDHLPEVGQTVKICGDLYWDADGFLEIHPGTAGDVTTI